MPLLTYHLPASKTRIDAHHRLWNYELPLTPQQVDHPTTPGCDSIITYGDYFNSIKQFIERNHDADLINAGKQTVTVLDGGSIFNSATSFAIIRGQHVQLTVLGAMEVAQNGDIANLKIHGRMLKGMGGSMDLVASSENIIVAMMHTNKLGESKLLKKCYLQLTGVGCVKRIATNLAVIEVTEEGFKLLERAPGVSVETIKNATEGTLIIEGYIPIFSHFHSS